VLVGNSGGCVGGRGGGWVAGGWVGCGCGSPGGLVGVDVRGAAVQKMRVEVGVGVMVRVTVAVRVRVWVGVGVSVCGRGVSVKVGVTVGVKVTVGVRVKNGREVGVLVVLDLKSSERKDNRPVNPAQMNKITGIATSSQARPSNHAELMIDFWRRIDLGKPSRQACM
jgi:hypothetical protein